MPEQEDYFYMLVFGAALIAMAFSISSCGIIKGSKNPAVDKVIKGTENFYPQDNPVEESIEQKIEDFTGVEVDLSPETPEVSTPGAKNNPFSDVPSVGYGGGGGH